MARRPATAPPFPGVLRCVAFAAGLLLLLEGAVAFKAEEFKKCADAGFCRRHRSRVPGTETFSIKGAPRLAPKEGALVADVVNEQTAASFVLELTPYPNVGAGIVRVRMTEATTAVGKRFEVPDVLLPDLPSKQAAWGAVSTAAGATTADLPGTGGCHVSIAHRPLVIEAECAGSVVLRLNGHQLLSYEHLRTEKKETDEAGMWEESFRSWTDPKKRGPEAIGLDVSMPAADFAYGLPERATSFALKPTRAGAAPAGEPYRLYNLDVFEYLPESPFGLYGAVPYLIGHSATRTVGAFWLNAAEMFVDIVGPPAPPQPTPEPTSPESTPESIAASIAASVPAAESPVAAAIPESVIPESDPNGPGTLPGVTSHWMAEAGVLDLFLLLGPRPGDVFSQYAHLTGGSTLPPLFALGYHQCRWNYRDEADATAVDAGFDEHDMPYDVLWLDIEHTDGKRYLTWDAMAFPNPARLQEAVAAKGRTMVAIVDPHLKRDAGYAIHAEASRRGHYVRNKDGGEFDGWCWPGSSSYLDVLSPEVRSWWAGRFGLGEYKGSTKHLHIWNDMNEPSVFNGPEVTMPKDNLQFGGIEHREAHNLYGLHFHMATAQGLLQRSGGTARPFVLSRALFAGTQRVGPVWTGDNAAEWSHLRASLPMLLTLGAAGVPFSGADVGGFFGNPEVELLVRWYQLGTYYPFFRGHAHLDTKRREPWLFGEPATSRIRAALRARYAILPYLYTVFDAAATVGTPILRPLWAEFPADAATFATEDAFLLGPSLLVAPVLHPGVTTRAVYLPGGATTDSSPGADAVVTTDSAVWYDWATGAAMAAGTHELTVTMDSVPAFVRGGSVVPRRDRARRSTAAMAGDPLTLVIALDGSGAAGGDLYLDDGHSLEHASGAFSRRRLEFLTRGDGGGGRGVGVLTCRAATVAPGRGAVDGGAAVERIVVLGLPSGSERVTAVLLGPGAAAAVPPALRGSSGDRPLEADTGTLWPPGGAGATGGAGMAEALVVRKPGVHVTHDWAIQFSWGRADL